MKRNSTGLLTLLGIGGYYLYRNREQVGRFLNERNIHFENIPFLNRFVSQSREKIDQVENPKLQQGSDLKTAV